MSTPFKIPVLYFLFTFITLSLVGAIIPHQGRIKVGQDPFNGIGQFKFALVDQLGKVRWNHENGDGIPDTNLSLQVNQGFYNCRLGDISIPGMEPLADDLFTYDDPLSLRIWFSDGTSDLEQLGPDQPLLVAPYATATPWTKTDEIASLLSKELDEQSAEKDTSSLSLIERIVSLGSSTLSDEDFNGSISLEMLAGDVHDRIVNLEGNNTKVAEDLALLDQKLEIHINAPIERQGLSSTVVNELNGIATTNQEFEGRISQSETQILSLVEDNQFQDTKIQNLEGNITQIIDDIIETNQDLSDYQNSPIKRTQLDFTLALELDDISELNQDQQNRLTQLDRNVSDLSNREIARQVELNDFEEDLSDIIKKHQEQTVQIVDMERDLSLHETKDGIQDTQINEINDEIDALKDSDDFTDSEISGINDDITDIMTKNTIQDAELTENNSEIFTLTGDLMNLDGNYSAFKSLVEKYLKPEILAEPSVSNGSGPINASADDNILIEMEASGKFLNYQWFLAKKTFAADGSVDREDYSKIPDSNSRTLEINQANASEDEGWYRVEVSNEFGDVNSTEILINIL